MKYAFFASSCAAVILFSGSASAQTPRNPNIETGVPESLQIQRQTEREISQQPNTPAIIPPTAAPTVGSPGTTQIERNRIDAAAPSRQRLQIDDGVSGSIRQSPTTATTGAGGPTSSGAVAPSGTAGTSGTSGVGAPGGTSGSATGAGTGGAGAAGNSSTGDR